MEKELMNIDVHDTLMIQIALLHYIEWLESGPTYGLLDHHLINHCKTLVSQFDELVERNH